MLENDHLLRFIFALKGCASIMWKDANKKQQAADALKYTATDVVALGCVDDVLGEPDGGSHNDPAAGLHLASVDERLRYHLASLRGTLSLNQLLDERYRKFRQHRAVLHQRLRLCSGTRFSTIA